MYIFNFKLFQKTHKHTKQMVAHFINWDINITLFESDIVSLQKNGSITHNNLSLFLDIDNELSDSQIKILDEKDKKKCIIERSILQRLREESRLILRLSAEKVSRWIEEVIVVIELKLA